MLCEITLPLSVSVVFLLTFVYRAEQHLVFPINYCHVATACIHDSQPVCASTLDGCSRRSFLDQCDMFEYNCDYGTDYEMLACENSSTNDKSTEAKDEPKTSLMHSMPSHEYFYSIYKEKQEALEMSENEVVVTKLTSTTIESTDKLAHVVDIKKPVNVLCSSSHCGRPQTWATTMKGETRDFYRILGEESR